MVEINTHAIDLISMSMREAGLDGSRFAIRFHVDTKNRLLFHFTDDIFYAKPHGGILVVDETGDVGVVVEGVFKDGKYGIIIKEKQ
jgi:hypothetical protein